MEPFFITTCEESTWIPDLLLCRPRHVVEGPNRSDYLLATVEDHKGRYPEELVIATWAKGDSLERIPDEGSIGVYIVQLKHRLTDSDHSFTTEDIQKWQLGSAYGLRAARILLDSRH